LIERIIIVVLDGVGAGELPDAAAYGDTGSNTLAHTAEAVGGLHMPHMERLGLGCVTPIRGVPPAESPGGAFGRMREASPGKDTITGHWEMAGVVLERAFPTYPHGFPADIMARFEAAIGTRTLGNVPASGTEIIQRLGAEHVATGYPIVYTSADSVFQIAMHEAVIPIERQYEICEIARGLLTGEHAVGRVICRPFEGSEGAFRRTERRKDYPLDPPPTVLDALVASGRRVHAIGKIYEIFNGRGISSWDHTTNNAAHTDALQAACASNDSALIFANLEDFDMLYGHRNDAAGMARALEEWDRRLPGILSALRPGDLLLITADHGNDPTTPSTDHSREYPFLLATGPSVRAATDLGERATYADIAATVREAFGLPQGGPGRSFLGEVLDRVRSSSDDALTVTPATSAEAETVIDILVEAARWHVEIGVTQWFPDLFTDLMRSEIERQIAQGEVYLARAGDEPVATLTLQWSDLEIWETDDGLAGYVHRLAVRRAWAGRRIGEALLRWAGARCAEAGKPYLRLDTTSRNPAICAYYERLGFEQRGINENAGWKPMRYERPAIDNKELGDRPGDASTD
jgi:phosphopentomutase